MLDLSTPKAPFDIALPYGLTVTVKPLTTAGIAAAQAAARRAVEAIERRARGRQEAGLALDGLPDLSAEGERDGFYQAQLIRELALRQVMSWTGVELGGEPAPPTPENIGAVMELYPVGERFFREFTVRQVLLKAAKNGRGPSAAGISSRVGGPNIAEPAATTASLAPRGESGADGQRCPYREHALISRQEHEAWEVLLACQGQLRLAPSGHVIGIDMSTALSIGAARPRPRPRRTTSRPGPAPGRTVPDGRRQEVGRGVGRRGGGVPEPTPEHEAMSQAYSGGI
jgi:hypothetical protein